MKTSRRAFARSPQRHGRPPGLGVVLAGRNPASEVYVRNKIKTVGDAGCRAELFRLDDTATAGRSAGARAAGSTRTTRSTPSWCSRRLPAGMGDDAEQRVFDAIDPAKDVDGFHPRNVGLLVQKRPALVACTPLGCIELLEREGIPLRGKQAVVHRPQRHRRQADGDAAAASRCDRDGLPLADRRAGRRWPGRPTCWWRPSAGRPS